mmetsp:Transcript_40356/g.45482  ORF Transcript_40356/g.45482 Transcript_40356/m.45482 type:complete len:106 (+) Transcript_40356:119-436(+)
MTLFVSVSVVGVGGEDEDEYNTETLPHPWRVGFLCRTSQNRPARNTKHIPRHAVSMTQKCRLRRGFTDTSRCVGGYHRVRRHSSSELRQTSIIHDLMHTVCSRCV